MTDEEFFQEADVGRLAETHADKLRSLSEEEAGRILTAYKRARQDLTDRLQVVRGGTFTEAQLRGTLAQVDAGIAELSKILGEEMGQSAFSAAGLGIEHLFREIVGWNKTFAGSTVPISVDAVRVAADTRNLLLNKYESSIGSYSAGLRSRIAYGLTDAAIQTMSMGEVMSKLSKTFLGEQWKLEQIVRTELSNIYSTGKLNAMTELVAGDIPDLMKTLWHPMDSRTGEDSKRLAQNNPIVPVDEPFVEDSTGKTLTYMAPPNRPNDRAIMIPYRKAWAET